MKRSRLARWTWVAALGFVLPVACRGSAEDKPDGDAKQTGVACDVIELAVHPTDTPIPVLKYHLLPTLLQRTPGNAVPLYFKALVSYKDTCSRLAAEFEGKSVRDRVYEWLNQPLDKMPRDEIRKLFGKFESVFSGMEAASRRDHCDWDPLLRSGDVLETELGEIQSLRDISWMLAVRARLQIAEKEYDAALATIQVGYSLGCHVGQDPIFVSGLVGNALIHNMNEQLLTFLQQPGAPNLYWSLTELPNPMVDLVRSADVEYDMLYLQYPELQDLRTADRSPQYWDGMLRKYINEFEKLRVLVTPNAKPVPLPENAVAEALAKLPKAKADLVAAGFSQAELDAMTPARVILLNGVVSYEMLRDDWFKWGRVPYWQAREAFETMELRLKEAEKEEILHTSLILPAMGSIAIVGARHERDLAALRCIEALRLYAFRHAGKLPASLDDIKETPLPINAVTGKPFPYHLEGETAVLDVLGGVSDGSTRKVEQQYRISVAK